MKPLLLLVVFLSGLYAGVQAQNTDLPGPTANLQSLPSGSYIIAMDNTNQLNSSSGQIYKTAIAIRASALIQELQLCRIQHFTLSSEFFKFLYDNRIK